MNRSGNFVARTRVAREQLRRGARGTHIARVASRPSHETEIASPTAQVYMGYGTKRSYQLTSYGTNRS